MKYVSYAERTGAGRGAKHSLRVLMKAKFGEEGAALVDSLGEGIDFPRFDDLITAAAVNASVADRAAIAGRWIIRWIHGEPESIMPCIYGGRPLCRW